MKTEQRTCCSVIASLLRKVGRLPSGSRISMKSWILLLAALTVFLLEMKRTASIRYFMPWSNLKSML
jgi:hypothetical protein